MQNQLLKIPYMYKFKKSYGGTVLRNRRPPRMHPGCTDPLLKYRETLSRGPPMDTSPHLGLLHIMVPSTHLVLGLCARPLLLLDGNGVASLRYSRRHDTPSRYKLPRFGLGGTSPLYNFVIFGFPKKKNP